jgi:hypothetical protein
MIVPPPERVRESTPLMKKASRQEALEISDLDSGSDVDGERTQRRTGSVEKAADRVLAAGARHAGAEGVREDRQVGEG